jgi:hypothetical protein
VARAGSNPSHRLVDTRDLDLLWKQLKSIGDKELLREYAKALHRAAEPAAAYERTLWARISKRIPSTVRIRVRPGSKNARVVILAGGTATTRHAKVLEGYDSGRPYRHPVFARTVHGRFNLEASQSGRADWTWVAQAPPAQIIPQVAEHEAESAGDHIADEVERFIQDKLHGH